MIGLPSTPVLLLIAGLSGAAGGAWVTYRVVQGSEVRALSDTIRAMDASRKENEQRAALVAGQYLITVEEERKRNRVLQRRLRDAIHDSDCSFNADAIRLLNEARTGPRLPDSTAKPDAADAATAGAEAGRHLTIRQAGNNWLDDVESYNTCRARLNGLIEFLSKE